ncbi:hypothetical protein BCON_0032g00070 [Botryotinia convoluta]|uniref:C2H2-type domain-containing protein n=1 Tax=Botryotinia convoluta TaxID=54673 RepID=A0A4Z1IN18_9HELO|nr:hypothetical protein BCON_0032g00070 [Botryotinia convoluta]
MACRVCGFREDQCCCQHVNRDLPPEPRYTTTNNNSHPHSYSNLNHEAYISNIPHYSQSVDSNPIGNQSTHQLQEPGISYSSGYTPSTQLFCTSTGRIYDSPSLSVDPGAFTNNAHSHGSSVGWMKQSHIGDEAIQSSFAKPGQSIEPEVGWPSLGNPDAQRSFNTKYPSTNFTSMKSSQEYSPSGCDLSEYVNNWGQDPSQQNNLVASGNEGIQVAIEDNSRINQAGIVLRGPKPSGTSEAHYPFVNMAQSQYSPSYSYDHSQIQEPFTVVATNQEPAALDNQNQYSPSSTISDPYQLPCKCPHQKCRLNSSTKIFTESSDLQAHWYRAHEKRFSCPRCNAIFGTAAEVRRHSTAIHIDGPKEFTCEIPRCAGRAKEFNRKHRLKEHREKWHGNYYCSAMDCSRGPGHGFKDQTLLNEHLIKSHGHGEFR